jgi:hypothetical protein
VIPAFIASDADVVTFLDEARGQLKARTFIPLPVRERTIPKAGQPGKFRRLGIPAARDRLVQAALVLVLEPIFEADFKPVSYGFRPKRRAQDAIAEIHAWAPGTITGCSRLTSRRVSMSCRIRRFSIECASASQTAGSGPGQVLPQGRHHGRGGSGSGNGIGYAPGRDRLAAAGQHRFVGAGRTFLCQGRIRHEVAAGEAPQTRRCPLPDRPLYE